MTGPQTNTIDALVEANIQLLIERDEARAQVQYYVDTLRKMFPDVWVITTS